MLKLHSTTPLIYQLLAKADRTENLLLIVSSHSIFASIVWHFRYLRREKVILRPSKPHKTTTPFKDAALEAKPPKRSHANFYRK